VAEPGDNVGGDGRDVVFVVPELLTRNAYFTSDTGDGAIASGCPELGRVDANLGKGFHTPEYIESLACSQPPVYKKRNSGCLPAVHLQCTLLQQLRLMLTLERPQYTLTAFGDWLRDKRRRAGMSQDDLAIAADCSKTYISTLERGMHHTVTGAPPQPSKAMVEKLAIALGVPTREALAVAFGVADPGVISVHNIAGPIQNNPNAPVETRELHDDEREAVLRELPGVHLERMPRMADFARVGVAVERVLGWSEGAFMRAYGGNIADQHQTALDATAWGAHLMNLLDGRNEPWSGTATELLIQLENRAGDAGRRRRGFPQSPRALAGDLKRLAPNLRALGVGVQFLKVGKSRSRTIILENRGQYASAPSAASALSVADPELPDARLFEADANDEFADANYAAVGSFRAQADAADGADAKKPLNSDSSRRRVG
jgi:transcriptional regulator with XRE-family HTH domain